MRWCGWWRWRGAVAGRARRGGVRGRGRRGRGGAGARPEAVEAVDGDGGVAWGDGGDDTVGGDVLVEVAHEVREAGVDPQVLHALGGGEGPRGGAVRRRGRAEPEWWERTRATGCGATCWRGLRVAAP